MCEGCRACTTLVCRPPGPDATANDRHKSRSNGRRPHLMTAAAMHATAVLAAAVAEVVAMEAVATAAEAIIIMAMTVAVVVMQTV